MKWIAIGVALSLTTGNKIFTIYLRVWYTSKIFARISEAIFYHRSCISDITVFKKFAYSDDIMTFASKSSSKHFFGIEVDKFSLKVKTLVE